ncbi:hypothetical protein ABZP36_015757 [Zizania latifolia]
MCRESALSRVSMWVRWSVLAVAALAVTPAGHRRAAPLAGRPSHRRAARLATAPAGLPDRCRATRLVATPATSVQRAWPPPQLAALAASVQRVWPPPRPGRKRKELTVCAVTWKGRGKRAYMHSSVLSGASRRGVVRAPLTPTSASTLTVHSAIVQMLWGKVGVDDEDKQHRLYRSPRWSDCKLPPRRAGEK